MMGTARFNEMNVSTVLYYVKDLVITSAFPAAPIATVTPYVLQRKPYSRALEKLQDDSDHDYRRSRRSRLTACKGVSLSMCS